VRGSVCRLSKHGAKDARRAMVMGNLAVGAGYRCEIGDCVNIEVERVED
jgi:hypothetical protein